MTRSRASAKKAGSDFETDVAVYMAARLDEDRIERRTKNGNKDRGDLTGVRTVTGQRVVIEAKNVAKLNLSGWVNEAEVERGNDDAAVGLVVHKRVGYGKTRMGDQYVTLTLHDLTVLLGAEPHEGNA